MVKLLNCYIVRLFYGFIILLIYFFIAKDTGAATFTAGDLIKGASSSAVYYLDPDNKRYVFSNEKTYKSWYADFSQVKIISDGELRSIALGGSRLYKPGVRLLKIPNRPEVYEVAEYGVLKWLMTPEIAVARHGANWQTLVDDLPEIFFSDYRQGEPVETPTVTPVEVSPVETPVQTGPGSLTVSPSSLVASGSYVKKSTAIPAVAFRFGAGAGSDIKITSLTLTGYVDEAQGNADFGQGGDSDAGSTIFLRDLISNVYLYEGETLLAGPIQAEFGGQVYFKNINWTISSGATKHLTVKVDFSPDAPFLNNDRFAFDILRAGLDVVAQDQGGKTVVAGGDRPNGADSPQTIITILASGSLTIETDISAPAADTVFMGQTNVEFNRLKFTAQGEAFLVKSLTLNDLSSNFDRDIKKIWISYPKQDGTEEIKTETLWLGDVTFRNLNFYVPAGSAALKVFVDVRTLGEGAVSGDLPGFNFKQTLYFETQAQISDVIFTENNFGLGYLSNKTRTTNQMMIRKTKLEVALNPATPTGSAPGRGFVQMLKFDLTANTAGQAKVKELTFKINTTDVGTVGANNDLLEKLADITNEYGNNIGRGDLHFAEDLNNPLGEVYTGSISYSIYDASIRTIDTTPSGLETGNGDYGLLKFTFNYGSEIIIPAGTTRTLVFELNTSGLVSGVVYGPQRVWATLSDDSRDASTSNNNFEWNDGEADATGYLVSSLPVVGRILYFE